MTNKLLYILSGFLSLQVIKINDKPYLERYRLFKGLYLHRFVSADGDRHIHDHPWAWALSIILLGGYIEELYNNVKIERKYINLVGPGYFHRICDIKPNTWTLFFYGKTIKGWGFIEGGQYRYSDETPESKAQFYLAKNHPERLPL